MGSMHKVQSRLIQRNMAFWAGHRKRIVEAIGPDVIKYSDDFTGINEQGAAVPDNWEEATVGASNAQPGDGEGGIVQLVTGATEDNGCQMQLKCSSFSLASGRELYFGTRLKINDATQTDFFAGLAVTDTTILGGVTDSIGFRKVDGSTAVEALSEKDSTETSTASVHTLADDTWVELEFYWDGTTAEFYVDQVSVASHTTNIPNDVALRASLALLTGEAAAQTLSADWVRVFQFGRGL